jgi:hypothetical protein
MPTNTIRLDRVLRAAPEKVYRNRCVARRAGPR